MTEGPLSHSAANIKIIRGKTVVHNTARHVRVESANPLNEERPEIICLAIFYINQVVVI